MQCNYYETDSIHMKSDGLTPRLRNAKPVSMWFTSQFYRSSIIVTEIRYCNDQKTN